MVVLRAFNVQGEKLCCKILIRLLLYMLRLVVHTVHLNESANHIVCKSLTKNEAQTESRVNLYNIHCKFHILQVLVAISNAAKIGILRY